MRRVFYEFLDFCKCKTKEDIVSEIKRCARMDADMYLAKDENDAESWLLQPFEDDGDDVSGIEIYHRDVYCETVTIHDEDGDSVEYRLSITAWFLDPGSAEYAYTYDLAMKQ